MLEVNHLIGFGAGGGGAYSTKWRLLMDSGPSTTYVCVIPECEMAADIGGVDQCVGGTATAKSIWSTDPSYAPSQAFDDVIIVGGYQSAYPNVGGGWPQWLQYEFLSPVSVRELRLITGTGDYGQALYPGLTTALQYYDTSLSDWVTAATWAGLTPDANHTLTI